MTAQRAITCPACGGAIAVKAAGYSVSLGCQYCGALLDVSHPDVTVITQYEGAMQNLPIPLGRRGILFNTEWETVGALLRSDFDVEWTEMLLFNPYAGYRWLILSEGEWQFGTMLTDRPVSVGASAIWRGDRYDRDYDPSLTATHRVVGEFYWRVRAGDQVTATTYSHGEQIIAAEWSDDEVNWTHLVPLSADQVARAFALNRPKSPGPVQPFTAPDHEYSDGPMADGTDIVSDLMKMALAAVVTILLSVLVMSGFGYSSASVTNSTNVSVDGPEQSLTVGTVMINRPYQIVTLVARASEFENRWIDIDAMLVNRSTQQAQSAYGVVEHYRGTDSDGPWSEGSYNRVLKFAAVPRGTYDVVVELSAHSWGGTPADPAGHASAAWNGAEQISVSLTARAGGFMWSMLWLELALLLGVPLLMLWLARKQWDD